MKQTTWWGLSALVTAILLAILVGLWVHMNTYIVEPTQLVNEQTADEFLFENWEKRNHYGEATQKVKTGIFVQSLKFFNSAEVNLTGYIWQHYQRGLQDAIIPPVGEAGFVFPEQVDSGSDIEPHEVYRIQTDVEVIIGWYFEATLRQQFDYSRYPFDHTKVWVRMWHNQFSRNIVLVPDYQAYAATGLADIFGIEENIVLGAWERQNTFFDYHLSNYDTNFGIPDYIGQEGFPELHYNIVVKRKFENAFIIYLLPLFLVAMLLFAALLTVSGRHALLERFGFNTSGFIAGCSALFFVTMLAHIQLREQFEGGGIVYIEYFYILMYTLLVIATANTYLFSIRPKRWCGLILYQDNLLFKVGYWPVVLTCLILVTLGVL